jgi:hypothetical protein
MKNIEEIISSNKDLFDSAEPSEGHLERFTMKLENRFHNKKRIISIVPYLLKASVAALLITLSSLWTWDHYIRPGSQRIALGDVSPQYKEVENYYVQQVNIMEGEIANIDLENNSEQREMFLQEMKSMDSTYIQLQKELKANPDDERIINAMIEHYQTKIDVMNFIMSQLKATRSENQTFEKDEKTIL